MADTLSLISTISYIAAIVFAITAAALWFVFKIPGVIGDLSGRNAKKSIEQMRKNNEKTGSKPYRSSETNLSRGKLTETMSHEKKEKKSGKKKAETENYETGLLDENKARHVNSEATGVLNDEDATGILLDENATAPLETEPMISDDHRRTAKVKLRMIEEIIMIHTNEVL